MNESDLITQAMRVLGSRQSDAKREAAQKNVKLANAARRKPIAQIPCTCSTPTDSVKISDHQKSCLRYRAIKRRQSPPPQPPAS